tara:strand:+ start:471 stop:689 length:219 start_codon:yes stop_codon:yes gene_type:complete
MKHWKTNEDMGSGFRYSEKEHKEKNYNYLEKPEGHEDNLVRIFYLMRDWWSLDQLKKVQGFIDELIKDRGRS